MSNLNFRNPWEMTVSELQSYIAELETRVRNADSGSRLWKEELGLAKAEVLAKTALVEHAQAQFDTVIDIAQRKVSALAGIVEASDAVCSAWPEYAVALRMIRHQIEGVCRWLNEQSYRTVHEVVEDHGAPDWDDIPF